MADIVESSVLHIDQVPGHEATSSVKLNKTPVVYQDEQFFSSPLCDTYSSDSAKNVSKREADSSSDALPPHLNIKNEMVDSSEENFCVPPLHIKSEDEDPLKLVDPTEDPLHDDNKAIADDETLESKSQAFEGKEPHLCKGCGKTFKTGKGLKAHLKYCDQIIKHKCSMCFYETKYKEHLKAHVRRVHPTEVTGRPVCTGCGRSCKNEDSLKDHLKYCEKSIKEIVVYKCQLCSYQTRRTDNAAAHMRREHSLEHSTCTGCGKSFKTPKNLRSHMKYCEKTNEIVKHECSICFYETKWKYCLKEHIRRAHLNPPAPPSNPVGIIVRPNCRGCGKFYKSKKSLQNHLRCCDKVNDSIVKLKCSYCSHETKRKENLKAHIARVHFTNSIDRPVCIGCSKSFKAIETLKKHQKWCEKTNDRIVIFICFHCSHVTKRKDNLLGHIRRMHPVGVIERPTCPQCGRSYKNIYSLNLHKRHCGKPNNRIVKFKCFHCALETKWKNHLKEHIIRVHLNSEIVKHKCKLCKYETPRKSNLQVHIRRMHECLERPKSYEYDNRNELVKNESENSR